MEKDFTRMLATLLDRVFDAGTSVLVPTSSLVISGEPENSDEDGIVFVAILIALVFVLWWLNAKFAKTAE